MNAIKTKDPREELEAEDSYDPNDDGDCGNCHGHGCSACLSRKRFLEQHYKFLRWEMMADERL